MSSEPHPLALLLPEMSAGEFVELRESIRSNGQREPITLHWDGRLIDGRHREKVCDELGLPVASRVFEGADSDILAFVLDANLRRRHLSESQRAMVAAKLETTSHGGVRRGVQDASLHLDRATVARALNVPRQKNLWATLGSGSLPSA